MENLNKENFWNEQYNETKEAVSAFCEWIDKYKEMVDWRAVIGNSVKFHDLPLEMQLGVLQAYSKETLIGQSDSILFFTKKHNFLTQIAAAKLFFEELQARLAAHALHR